MEMNCTVTYSLFPSDFHFSSQSRAYSLFLSIRKAQTDLLKQAKWGKTFLGGP